MATHIPKTPPGGRTHLSATWELTEDEVAGQKKLLSQDKGEEVKVLSSAIQDEWVKKLATILFQKANTGITSYNKLRSAPISVGPGTPYDGILQLVFTKVQQVYGDLMDEAQKEAGDAGASYLAAKKVTLKPVDTRWGILKGDEARVKEEAELAAQYMVDTDDDVIAVRKAIIGVHPHDTPISVEQAYLQAVLGQDNPAVRNALAEYRIRWHPYTFGPDIYIETLKKYTYIDTWSLYRYLIHEVMHTAAHPSFMLYLREEVPAGVATVVIEGTTDYFAQIVWKGIVEKLSVGLDNEDTRTVQALHPGQATKLSKDTLTRIQYYAPTPLYPVQVAIIQTMVESLPSGLDRLKAAFFYGDVSHFFPFYKEKKKADEEGSLTMQTIPLSDAPPAKRQKIEGDMPDEEPVATRQLLLQGELFLLRDKWRQKVGQLNGTPPYWQETLDALQSTFNPPPGITAEQVAEEQRTILNAAKERWDVG